MRGRVQKEKQRKRRGLPEIDFYGRAVHSEDGKNDGRRRAQTILESHIERAYIDGSLYHQTRIEEFRFHLVLPIRSACRAYGEL